MEWIVVTGRTLDAAKERALDELGVHEAELEYQILAEARSGFLGLGRTEARIRARVKPISREKPNDRRKRRSREGRSSGSGRRPARDTDGATRGPAGAENEGEPARGEPRAASAGSGSSGRRRRRRGRGGSRSGAARGNDTTRGAASDGGNSRQGDRAASATPRSHDEGAAVNEPTIDIEEQAGLAREFCEGLVDAFESDARVRTTVDEDTVLVEVEGDELGVLVGPRGATLAAIEELCRAALQHATGGQSVRINVDVGGYRQRRRDALAEFARRLADEVRTTGDHRALEPMGAADRKVVHDALAEVEGVTTTSEGDEPRRRVVIEPD